MNPLVEKFLTEAGESARREEEEKKRQNMQEVAEKLLRRGYFEKEYAPEGAKPEDYPKQEKAEDGSLRRYKRVPIRLTEEEYERVKEYFPDVVSETTVSSVLKVTAILEVVAAVVLGLAARDLFLALLPLAIAVPTWALGELSKTLRRLEKRLEEKD